MKRVPQVFVDLKDQLAGSTVDSGLDLINAYFNDVLWSIEKSEWDLLSEEAKRWMVGALIRRANAKD